jgi:hypothetical protein
VQLQLWPADQQSTQSLKIWEDLDRHHKITVITTFARLIVKVIYPNNLNENQEKRNE